MSRNYNFYVYIMASSSGTLYIGVTNSLERRVVEHKNDLIEGFSKQYQCHRLVYYEQYNDIRNAIAREKQMKNWGREKKENLTRTMNPKWVDLSAGWLNLKGIPRLATLARNDTRVG
ncbi:hypothetical protein A2Y83_00455 [Candidatus Falkowbacteria bacterium RBG_13_39_14]|uniref:GIY-YIG domain-containing protein n=1 Tax=Candidatus Falkowbacteria bacterium RBG_13_39_14 TaxID=1797985 RepID=A0A1F5S7C9_9BACT|nr:MAG: hypothetical protein A2Y83_00455 [Candidatus Falkowbacteria bacterium RBG_13_39_14]